MTSATAFARAGVQRYHAFPIVTGKLQLATYVQYLPLPVVGGYLAFIGLYCLEAGLSLMTGVQVGGPRQQQPSAAAVADTERFSGIGPSRD